MHLYEPAAPQSFQFQFIIFDKLITGLDGISLWLIFLVNFISPIVILNSWRSQIEPHGFLTLIIIIQSLSILVFSVLDIFLFYLSFEAILIPMYLLIGFFGSRNKKIEAQSLFFLYTLLGSLFFLLSISFLIFHTGTSDYLTLCALPISPYGPHQYFLWFGFFIALAVKMPMIPFHIWLPQAHTEAPTGGSIILAAILLKLGTYGFLRYSLPLFPDASLYFSPFVSVLAIIGIIYSCISALSLIDLKQIIAYSSIAHMNISLIGLFSNDFNGLSGCFLYSISHGFVSGGLFLLVGLLYERYHTRTLKYYRGLALFLPLYVLFFFLFTLANMSFPGSLSFIAEMLIYFSALSAFSPLVLFLTAFGAILVSFYTILAFHKISFGSLSNHTSLLFQDITIKEFHLCFPLLFFTIFFGIFPNFIIDSTQLSLMNLLNV